MKAPRQPIDLEVTIEEVRRMGMRAWLTREITKAFVEARKGKRSTYDEHNFELNWAENIINLVDSILERTYRPSASVAFVVFEPMVREIFAAPFRDRSVHHLIHETVAGFLEQSFIPTSTSCRNGKGTQYAIEAAQEQIREVTEDWTKKARVVKLDVKGYFMSIPRNELRELLVGRLGEQFEPYRGSAEAEELYATFAFLWTQIIMDDPAGKARKKGRLSNWDPEILPPNKSLYCQPDEQGIVIGNLTSQLASNVFLGELDNYVTEVLGYKYYGRYVDDFYIMVAEEDYLRLKRDLKMIEKFLREELGLTLHPSKRYCQSVYKGFPYLGARVYPHCLYPSDRLQSKFRRAVHNFARGKGDVETVVSYLGHMRHMDADGFVRKVFREVGWDFRLYLETKQEVRRPMADIILEMSGREVVG